MKTGQDNTSEDEKYNTNMNHHLLFLLLHLISHQKQHHLEKKEEDLRTKQRVRVMMKIIIQT